MSFRAKTNVFNNFFLKKMICASEVLALPTSPCSSSWWGRPRWRPGRGRRWRPPLWAGCRSRSPRIRTPPPCSCRAPPCPPGGGRRPARTNRRNRSTWEIKGKNKVVEIDPFSAALMWAWKAQQQKAWRKGRNKWVFLKNLRELFTEESLKSYKRPY